MKRKFIYTYYLTMNLGKIFAGYFHSGFIMDNNWVWGYNHVGQLGDNTITNKCSPVSLLGNKKTFCQISAGQYHTTFTQNNGQVWCWGDNTYGQIGDNTITSRRTPVSILGNKKTFCKVDGGFFYSIGIQHNGQIWTWGYNHRGQLGDNSVTNQCTPVSILGNKKTFCQISTGYDHAISIQHNGQVWTWGSNTFGQLGNNAAISRRTPVSILGDKKTFCKVAGGESHTAGIEHNGQVWCWGYGFNGRLGNNGTVSTRTPVSIHGNKKTFCQISIGQSYTIGIQNNGQVWSWGSNSNGQLGNNTNTSRCTPVSILGAKKTFCQIKSGYDHVIALEYNNQVWGWGNNNRGQIGDNLVLSRLTPVSLAGEKKLFWGGGFFPNFHGISAGINFTVAIEDKNGQVWSWGSNVYGQLGDNSTTSRRTPVSILGNRKTFCQIVAGLYHTLAIQHNGNIWSWGYNHRGQLGNNSVTNRCTPVAVFGNKTFCQIAAGGNTSFGISSLGVIWSWGNNTNGQLGDNTVSSRRTPVEILGNRKTFVKIAAGQDHTLAIQYPDGQVWGWGFNATGQIGINSLASRRTPVSIFGNKKTFCQIAAGQSHSAGIVYNGLVWCWGVNNTGCLGDNTITSRRTPVSILGNRKTFCQIAAGINFTVAIQHNGQVWCWGNNVSGQLGDNSVTNKCTPVSIHGNKKTFCQISGGENHTTGIDNKSQVWSWGGNISGSLGDTSGTYTPIRVCNI